MGYIEGITISTCINIVCVCGLVILTGYTGLFSMGHACFMCLGAYASAILTKYYNVPFLLALLAGGCVAGASSLIIGVPTLRGKMSADCFAIATLGFGEAVRIIMSNVSHPYLGGARGMSGIMPYTTLPWAVGLALASIILTINYARSQHGKIALAIRDHQDASELIGVNIFHEKLKSLIYSAFFCGVGGGMMAHYYTYMVPNVFNATVSNNLLTSVVLGGVSSVTGPALGTTILTFTPEVLRFLSNWRLAIYGLVLVIIMRVRPEGLMGYREIYQPVVRLFKRITGGSQKHQNSGSKEE